MVYYGRSRACAPCKKRRKKCDQTRPSCMRCIKSNRACTGYEEPTPWTFKQYESHGVDLPAPFKSRARKCTLPKRTFIPGSEILMADVDNRGTEVSNEQLLDYAVRAFFYDFCVLPSDPGGSRGYLSNLEKTVNQLGIHSMLGKSCLAISYITHGQALQRPQLVKNAEAVYHEVVGCLAAAITHSGPRITAESKLVAMLLGIYEMSKPECTPSNSHSTHAKGLGALLGTGDSPLNLLNGLSSGYLFSRGRAAHPGKVHSLFSMAPSADQPVSLDNLLLHLDMLWTKYKAIHLQEDHHILRSDCEALKIRFIKWTKSQAAEVRQTTVTTLTQEKEASIIPVGCWPGPVYTYPDFYIAGIWNISRAAQLLLIMLMSKVADNVADTDSLSDAASAIVNDTMASIPYHLTENLYDFVNGPKTGIEEPGRTLGGLLIMHPLYVASRVPSIPGATRDYLQRCLMWISSNMGIRHADRLAQSHDVDEDFLRSACMIIWTGFLG